MVKLMLLECINSKLYIFLISALKKKVYSSNFESSSSHVEIHSPYKETFQSWHLCVSISKTFGQVWNGESVEISHYINDFGFLLPKPNSKLFINTAKCKHISIFGNFEYTLIRHPTISDILFILFNKNDKITIKHFKLSTNVYKSTSW